MNEMTRFFIRANVENLDTDTITIGADGETHTVRLIDGEYFKHLLGRKRKGLCADVRDGALTRVWWTVSGNKTVRELELCTTSGTWVDVGCYYKRRTRR